MVVRNKIKTKTVPLGKCVEIQLQWPPYYDKTVGSGENTFQILIIWSSCPIEISKFFWKLASYEYLCMKSVFLCRTHNLYYVTLIF